MIKFIVATILLGHGLAHLSGLFASWIGGNDAFSSSPWIFSDSVTFISFVGKIFGLLWLIASISLVLTSYGLYTDQNWWLNMAIGGSLLSLCSMVPWWNTVPPGAKVGIIFDIIVLSVLLTPLKMAFVNLISK